MSELYDQLGPGYTTRRKTDPRIFTHIQDQLQGLNSLLNVGAGTGSYEPTDVTVYALEPSGLMISQRQNRSNVVQAKVEFLPFHDQVFDATMTILTMHHWPDQQKGLEECARVARKRIVILTWDPESDGFWLVQDYFPELLTYDRKIFPSIDKIRHTLGPVVVQPVLIPADCADGFLGAYWRRPRAYLQKTVRAGMSSFSRIPKIESRISELKKDINSGAWERRHRDLLSFESLDIGYRLVTADLLRE